MTGQDEGTEFARALFWLMVLAIFCAALVLSGEIQEACLSLGGALNAVMR